MTKEELLSAFARLNYYVKFNDLSTEIIRFKNIQDNIVIRVDTKRKTYIKHYDCSYNYVPITFEEHYLLTELFKILGWNKKK